MKFIISVTILLQLCFVSLLSAQGNGTGFANRVGDNLDRGPSLDKIESKAAESYQEGDSYQAMIYYNRVLSVDSNRISALKGFAMAADDHGAFGSAKWAYQRLLQLDPAYTDAQFELADIYFREGKYDEAKNAYQAYINNTKDKTPASVEIAQDGIDKAEWAKSTVLNSDFSLEAILLDTGSVNSVNTSYSEYMNWPNGDGSFLFSSYRFPFKHDSGDKHRERRLVKVMEATPSADTLATSVASFNESKKHTMHVTFDTNGDVMYYAQGEFINSAEIRSELYMRKKSGSTWGEPVKLPAFINVEGYTSTEPSIGLAPSQTEEVLYFVSDRPGGKGKRDIWYSLILPNGTFTEPANLSQINTAGDDVTPFYHSPTGTLYFSTEGQQTLGGFDVYKSVGNGLYWSSPEHLAPPVNTSANDVFFTLTKDVKTAYLSSNRLGSANISEEACCYDIFQVPLVKPKMVAVSFRADTKDSLMRTTIKLYELVDGKPVLRDSAINIPGTYYPFSVNPGKSYFVTGEKPGFKPDTTAFVTPRQIWPGVMSQPLYLDPMKVDLVATVYDKRTKEPIIGATARFVDLGPSKPSGDIAGEEGKVSSNAAGNDYYYPLEFDHEYVVYITKNGYTIDSTRVSTAGLRESTTLKERLEITRGINLEALVYDNTTRNLVPIKGVKFELFEVGKTQPIALLDEDLRPLDNRFTSVLDFSRRYRIVASKPQFSSDTVDFNVPALSSKPFDLIQQELQIHSLALENYLPIRLYFDNDRPDARTLSETTKVLYSQSYFAYYPKKDTFIQVYTTYLKGAELEKAVQELEVFFEDSLKGEWNRLRFFTEVLFEKLKRGDHVEITLKGFASRRAPTNYNKNLTKRRILSVMNHFSSFDGAQLRKYVESEQLIVTEEPNGETSSREEMKEPKISETRNSVFSPAASKERRVEIIGIEVTPKK